MASRVRAPRQIFLFSRARLLSGLSASSAPVKDAGASGPLSSGGNGQRSLRSSWQKLAASAKEHAGLVSILGGAAGLVYMAAGLKHQQELRVERLQKEVDMQKKEFDSQLQVLRAQHQAETAQVGGHMLASDRHLPVTRPPIAARERNS